MNGTVQFSIVCTCSNIGIIWGNLALYRDSGKEHGNYYLGFNYALGLKGVA